jgi:Tol biopolymer transport system component
VRRAFVAALGLVAAAVQPAASGGVSHPPSRIAFALERGNLSSLYTVRPDGTGLRRLTVPPTRQDLGGDSGPVWSPDGRRIVFERNLPYWGADRFRLVAVPAKGGVALPLTDGPFDVMPTFAPDGRRLAFTRLTAAAPVSSVSLFTIGARGQHPLLLLADGIDLSPAWSPDGRTIAFARLASSSAPIEEATLHLAGANGSNVRPLPLNGVSPAWSPDGRRLAFVSFADHNGVSCPGDCAPSGEIYIANADGSGLQRLTHSRADDERPTWSPDGTRLAFASGFGVRSLGHAPWLMTMPSRGGRAARLGRFAGVIDPAWSPAGVR